MDMGLVTLAFKVIVATIAKMQQLGRIAILFFFLFLILLTSNINY